MPSKITPKPGEVWEREVGRDESVVCFIYFDGRYMRRAWMGEQRQPDIVPPEMVDGENGWKRVYAPAPDYSGLFIPLRG